MTLPSNMHIHLSFVCELPDGVSDSDIDAWLWARLGHRNDMEPDNPLSDIHFGDAPARCYNFSYRRNDDANATAKKDPAHVV